MGILGRQQVHRYTQGSLAGGDVGSESTHVGDVSSGEHVPERGDSSLLDLSQNVAGDGSTS